MISLFLDTSTKYVTVAIIKEEKILYYFHEKVFEELSIKILPLIDTALKNCSLDINDIEKIYVVNGPGSFTGIRIGLTIAKIMAWSLNKPIIPISSLELIASTKVDTKYIIPYIDARRGNCFVALYDQNLNKIEDDQFVEFEFFINKIKDMSFTIVSYDDIANRKIELPDIDVLKVIKKHANDLVQNAHSVNPNYLKLTEAEENLKNKNDNKN